MSTINKKEIEKFSKMADEWWDTEGKFKPLHKFNPLRINYIKKKITSHFNIKSKFWTSEEKIQVDKDLKVTEIFKKETIFEKELNPQLEIKLSDKIIQDSFINNLNNNNGRTNYNGSLKKSSRFKFVKIDKFDFAEPEIVFDINTT